MILCVNLNAAIDKTIVVNSFRLGDIHRPEAVKALPGGKGCNVARALKLFGEEPVVTGWVGGTTGQFIENGLQQEGIGTDFVYTDFESRTCTSILDSSNQMMTEVYEKGDPVPPQKVDEMLVRFGEMVGKYTAVTLSGSLPPGVPSDFYAQLIYQAHKVGVPAFLDSSKDALLQGVAAKPFLIKPNETEVAVLAQRELTSLADFAEAAAEISTRFETIVVLSLGKAGAIAVQGETAVHAQNPVVEAKSAVGSGDSLLAGLVFGFGNGRSLADSARLGVAAGTANTLRLGAAQFTRQDFERIYGETAVEPLTLSG
ncbi:MAG: 1-phosphofructokinase family hexose kinase [Anaerolineaceae bacterium]|nr:1-phosphofructokinase family hexose kinase [Anaerolineaceae bacterium]